MQIIKGKYTDAIVLATNIDEVTIDQIHLLCDQAWAAGSHIVIQPDAHAGAGCVIGTTMTITDKICPNIVGVDLNCGLTSINVGKLDNVDFELLDECVHKIPAGFNVWNKPLRASDKNLIKQLRCYSKLHKAERLIRSQGTLGGGNHYIELGKADSGDYWLTVHSGSRNLGLQVANYYQNKAIDQTNTILRNKARYDILTCISIYRNKGEYDKIEERLQVIRDKYNNITPPNDLCYLTNGGPWSKENVLDDYLHDVDICRAWASHSREIMLNKIIENYNSRVKKFDCFDEKDKIETIHNYIDTDAMILRKGSVSAKKGERFLLPINMAEGMFICEGLGNKEYNYSAPHGAGRVLPRKKAKNDLSVDVYKKKMEGVYSTCISEKTLDESPMAYKSEKDIIPALKDSVKVLEKINSVYNFKAE